MEVFRPEFIYIVPSAAKALMNKKRAGVSFIDNPSVKPDTIGCTGAPLTGDVRQLVSSHGIKIFDAYGMSEVCGNITNLRVDTPDDEGRLLREHTPHFVNGEFCIESPANMLGYYKNPAATAETLDEKGWLHTGDIGHFDEGGHLVLTGRIKNVIILSNGENVSPEKIEGILVKNPLINEIVVYAKDDKIHAQVYIGKADSPETRREVEGAVKQYNSEAPTFERISSVSFRETEFEKTSSGKIIRKAVIFAP